MLGVRPPGGFKKEDTAKRRKWLEEKTGYQFLDGTPEEPDELKGIIENHVGYVRIPMAVTGPLLIHGDYADGIFYVPLCTLEGTLTMSMTRGLFAMYLSGGIKAVHIKQEISRSPIFIFDDIDKTKMFVKWIEDHYEEIKSTAESTTKHGKLLRIDKYTSQNAVILDFLYDTGEAAGQNMVTIATYIACKYIKEKFEDASGYRYYLESNFSGDKNPAYKTLLVGRSHQVITSAFVKKKILKRMFRASAREFADGWIQANSGSQIAGVVGSNKHVANALTAIYLATGQDAACVAENALGIMHYEVRNGDDLYINLTMPSISVGTVGGGTRLKQQKNNLELMGCTGKNSSKKLAEIICACAMALELSLGGAIASDEFAISHANYGRQ